MLPIKTIAFAFVFIVADILSGWIKAMAKGEWKSTKMREGLVHKIGEILIIGFGCLCEYAFPVVGVQIELPIVTSICVYIIVMETTSVLENILEISPGLAEIINKVFRKKEGE